MDKTFAKAVNFIADRHFFIHIFLVIVVLVFGIGLYFQQGTQTQESLAQQMLHREQVITRSGSISLSVFVQSLSDQVSTYSSDSDIVSYNKNETPEDLNSLLNSWQNTPVTGVVLINKNGVVTYGVDRMGETGIGTDVSTREYYLWSKTAKAGDRYIGSPIVSKIGFDTGRYIVPVVSPIIKDGKFNGVLVVTFLVDEATAKFLDPLKISKSTLVFVLDHDGNFVFSPIPKLIGTNFTNLFSGTNFPGKDKIISGFKSEFANSDSQGKFDITIPNLVDGNALTRFLMTYSVVNLGPGNDWSLIVMTPASMRFSLPAPSTLIK